jgi:hypothetical protein
MKVDFFLFRSPCTLCNLDDAMPLLRPTMTSSRLLRLHIDRGLERHGYPWVPIDQGPRGLYQVDPTCQKPHRPASGPIDLIHNPEDLGRYQKTLSRSQRIRRAWSTRRATRSRPDAASRSADREILLVIKANGLPNL